jgi:hypothetical protein
MITGNSFLPSSPFHLFTFSRTQTINRGIILEISRRIYSPVVLSRVKFCIVYCDVCSTGICNGSQLYFWWLSLVHGGRNWVVSLFLVTKAILLVFISENWILIDSHYACKLWMFWWNRSVAQISFCLLYTTMHCCKLLKST